MKLIKILLVLVVLAAVAAGITYFYAGTILKTGITKAGPAIAGVPVELESVQVNPVQGNVGVDQLVIRNPENFETDYAFKIDGFHFEMVPMSVFGDTMHIKNLVIDGAIVLSDGLAADNHRAILKNIQAKIPQSKDSDKTKDTSPSEPNSAKKLIIDHFAFTNSSLAVYLDGEEITKVAFPNVELNEIGSKGNALTAAEALTQIYTAIASETTKVLTINETVIENIARAKLKKIGINDIEDLKDPKKLLDNPEKLGNILDALIKPKPSGSGK